MSNERGVSARRPWLVTGALVALIILVVPIVAIGASHDPGANSASVRGQLTKLKRQVAGLQSQVAGAASQPGPPNGAAAGDLTGTYPAPQIAAGAVGTAGISHSIPAVRAETSPAQVVPSGGDTALIFVGETYDTGNMHSLTTNTSRFIAPVSGVYELTAIAAWPQDYSIYVRRLSLRKNGSTILASVANDTAQVALSQSVATVADLAAGDYVEVVAVHLNGTSLVPFGKNFTMTWVAPGP